jgi:folate-binding protein YgfZ
MMEYKRIRVSGSDAVSFLQGLVSNDVTKLLQGPKYAALLTPQGKYICDFFMLSEDSDVSIEVPSALAAGLMQRLSMYKLRADVRLDELPGHLHRGLAEMPQDGWQDPRHEALGWRAWRDAPQTEQVMDWDAIRVAHMVPEYGAELSTDSFILEMNFEALGGVDFKKGCYVGQEVTARMKHKTELRKGLARVKVEGDARSGAEIFAADGKPAGRLHTRAADEALAYLRFDRARGQMRCEDAQITWLS